MGILSNFFGGSKSTQTSESSGYGYQGSISDQFSQSTSRGAGTSTQGVFLEDIFRELYGSATGATQRAAELVPALQGQAAQLFGAGSGFLESLGGSPIADRLAETGTADAQIEALGGDLGRFLSEQLNPAITSQGVATGTLGGGRQGVAQGLAADAVARQFQQGATAIRGADVARRDQLAQALAADRLGAAGVGLGALPGLFGLAQGGVNAGLTPYAGLASILGGPTVLTESSQFSESDALSQALARAFGEDFQRSKSTGVSRGPGLGFSLLNSAAAAFAGGGGFGAPAAG